MIWSVIPEEIIFDGAIPSLETIENYHGKKIVARQGRVETLLSTNPLDFLDSRFFPGEFISREMTMSADKT